MGKFVFGGAITSELLNSNAQKDFNVLGGEAEQTISYFEGSFLASRPNIGLTISASDNHFVAGSYQPDLFNVVFRGNAPYAGDTMDFSLAHGQYTHYQNYAIGLYDKRTQSYIRLGFLVGNQGFNYRVGDSQFHTNEDGSNLFFKADITGHSTANDSSNSYFSGQGYGFALELNHNFNITTKTGKKHIINFNLSNLGSIFWNNQTENILIDSSYNFSGFDYSEINSVPNADMDFVIDTLGITVRTGTRRESLPIQVIINKMPVFSSSQKWQSTFGFKALLMPDYRPMIFGGVYYQPNEWMSFTTRAMVGGFGGLRFSLNANFWLKENLYIGLSTLNVVGMASNELGRGKSANLALQYNF